MATVVDRVSEAHQLDPANAAAWAGRGILVAITCVLYGAGWLMARSVSLLWAAFSTLVWPALSWCVTAVRTGWREGWRPPGRTG